jgi:hypothetical protein
MAQGERKNWRELCKAALNARDPDELLGIAQELNKALKREEQIRRDFREGRELISLPARSEVKSRDSGDAVGYNEAEAEQVQLGAHRSGRFF